MRVIIIILIGLVPKNANSDNLFNLAYDYIKPSDYLSIKPSPNGKLFLSQTTFNNKENIEVLDLSKKKSYLLFEGTDGVEVEISSYFWIDNDSILIKISRVKESHKYTYIVMHIYENDPTKISSSFDFKLNGLLIDPLIKSKNKAIFSYKSRNNISRSFLTIDLSTKDSIRESVENYKPKFTKIKNQINWKADPAGNINFIVSKHKKHLKYWAINNNKLTSSHKVDQFSQDSFTPKLVNKENNFIGIHTIENTNRAGVYEFDPKTLKPIKKLFYSSDFDVYDFEYGYENSELLSLTYYKNGKLSELIFDQELDKANKLLRKSYPNFDSIYLSKNLENNVFQFFIFNFETIGSYIQVSLSSNSTIKIIDKSEHQNHLPKANLEILNTKTHDGFLLESFLSLPNDKINALLVMPHGGPIGVQSNVYFNSLSHFLSNFGIAVLRTNYRGSSGYGKEFLNSGKKQWGKEIENDIHSVTKAVIEKYKINKNKVCSGGTSYGGYSALMLHIQHPKIYNCIISMAGPTDLPLLFSSSDWDSNPELFNLMKKIVGNPDEELEFLMHQSPLYNSKNINMVFFYCCTNLRLYIKYRL